MKAFLADLSLNARVWLDDLRDALRAARKAYRTDLSISAACREEAEAHYEAEGRAAAQVPVTAENFPTDNIRVVLDACEDESASCLLHPDAPEAWEEIVGAARVQLNNLVAAAARLPEPFRDFTEGRQLQPRIRPPGTVDEWTERDRDKQGKPE